MSEGTLILWYVTCSSKTIRKWCLTSHEHNNVVNIVSFLYVEQYLILSYLLTICLYLKNRNSYKFQVHKNLFITLLMGSKAKTILAKQPCCNKTKPFLHINLLIKYSVQQQIHFNDNVFENKCCRCDEGSLHFYSNYLYTITPYHTCQTLNIIAPDMTIFSSKKNQYFSFENIHQWKNVSVPARLLKVNFMFILVWGIYCGMGLYFVICLDATHITPYMVPSFLYGCTKSALPSTPLPSNTSCSTVCCGYSSETPQWSSSNEYPQQMFSCRNINPCFAEPGYVLPLQTV